MKKHYIAVVVISIIIFSVLGYIASNKSAESDISICDTANGPFSLEINNPYLPYPVGQIQVLEDKTEKVQISVLNKTETVNGIETRVVEEREWKNGELQEVSRNFYVQTPDGTVCYFGEDVDDYTAGRVTGHGGAWRAGDGVNKPGIIMPANPRVGQTYQQEIAPGVAMDRAEHIALENSFTTPIGTFKDVLYVKEIPASEKRYAKGVGLIFDDGLLLSAK